MIYDLRIFGWRLFLSLVVSGKVYILPTASVAVLTYI
jgi:hypothetical protein